MSVFCEAHWPWSSYAGSRNAAVYTTIMIGFQDTSDSQSPTMATIAQWEIMAKARDRHDKGVLGRPSASKQAWPLPFQSISIAHMPCMNVAKQRQNRQCWKEKKPSIYVTGSGKRARNSGLKKNLFLRN